MIHRESFDNFWRARKCGTFDQFGRYFTFLVSPKTHNLNSISCILFRKFTFPWVIFCVFAFRRCTIPEVNSVNTLPRLLMYVCSGTCTRMCVPSVGCVSTTRISDKHLRSRVHTINLSNSVCTPPPPSHVCEFMYLCTRVSRECVSTTWKSNMLFSSLVPTSYSIRSGSLQYVILDCGHH